MADIFDFYVYDDRSIQFAIAEPIMLEDKDVTQFRFRIPKVLNNIDMTDWEWWFIFVNAKKMKYTTQLTLTDDEDDPDNFSVATYTVGYGFSGYVGSVSFSIEALNVSGEDIVNEWHTRTYNTNVIDTLQGTRAVVPEPDGQAGTGLTEAMKQALLQIAQKVAYIDEHGQTYYNNLYDALYAIQAVTVSPTRVGLATIGATSQLIGATVPSGGTITWTSSDTSVATVSDTGLVTSVGYGTATITGTSGGKSATCSVVVAQAQLEDITAVYTQSGIVYNTDTLDSLKPDLVVTAYYDNQTSAVVTDYTLSGTLTEGTSTITVSYGGLTATFDVIVTAVPPYEYYDYIQGDGTAYINTGLLASTYCTNDYEQEVKVAGHTTESSKAVCGARQQWGSANARTVWHTNATYSQTYCGKDTGYTMSGSSLDVPVVIKTTTDKKIYCDEALVDTATGAVSITHTGPITLFAECTSGNGSGYAAISGTNAYAGAFSKSRIYYFKVKDGNGNLVADLRPAVRISDSAIGMYDLIRDEFYQNARDTGALSVGNE